MSDARLRGFYTAGALLLILTLTACATVNTRSPSDPLEGINRTFFQFNDTLDQAAFQPVAKAYARIVPPPVRTGITNIFANMHDIRTLLNSLLQGKIIAGSESLMRMVINTFFGVGGFFDVASGAGLPKHYADFGQTLGLYGIPPGPYLVLPFWGPKTLRGTIALPIDLQTLPISHIDILYRRYALYGWRAVSRRAELLQAGQLLENTALDKYTFVRNAYLQYRKSLVQQKDSLPDYQEEDE
jgi:phospholipid-binding lipoprotein MlaA